MSKYRNATKRIGALLMWLILINVSFFVLARDVYGYFEHQISLILFCFFTCADLSIRPISAKKDRFRSSITYVSFLVVPFVLVLPFHESQVLTSHYLPVTLSKWVVWLGIGFLIAGGILLLTSRIQIGRYGSSRIVIEDEHSLITQGIYGYIRYPLYLGFLLLFCGFSLSFQSFIFTFLIVSGLFVIFKKRMDMEETLLESEFGEEYKSYVKKTKRLVPCIY